MTSARKIRLRIDNHRLAFGLFILLILVASFAVFVIAKQHDSSIRPADAQHNRQNKEAVVNNGGTPVSDSGSKGTTPASSYTPPNTNAGIAITPSMSGRTVIVSTKLTGYSDGTCTLTITNGDQKTTQTAAVIFAPNYSSCAGFSVPISTLGAGTWDITLNVASGGNTTSKSVNYEVQ